MFYHREDWKKTNGLLIFLMNFKIKTRLLRNEMGLYFLLSLIYYTAIFSDFVMLSVILTGFILQFAQLWTSKIPHIICGTSHLPSERPHRQIL